MIRSIREKLQVKEHRTIAENFLSLSVLQVLNYALPLVTFPYLTRVLGAEKFGLVAFAQALNTYFAVVVDYGFNMSGTREISVNRNDTTKLSSIVSTIFTIKFLLLLLSFVVLVLITFTVPKFRVYWQLYLLSFGMVIGNALFPVWFFQGIEAMKYITFLNFLAKLLFTSLIFVFVRGSGDYLYVPVLNSLGYVVAGILSLWIIINKFRIRIVRVPREELLRVARDGWHLFISRISISLYTVTNSFLLGLFESMATVGYYVAAEKIVRVSMNLFAPVFQSLYPFMTQKAAASRESAIRNLSQLLKVVGSLGLLLSLVFLFFAKPIALLVLGPGYDTAITLIRIFSVIPFVVAIASVLANLTMVPFKLDNYLMRIYVFGAIINFFLVLFLVGALHLKGQGAAVATVSTEFIITGLMIFVLVKEKINIFGSGRGR
jgi:O-antigen/teichoic acid export membrane protein